MDCNVVPDYVDVCVAVNLIFLCLLGEGYFVLLGFFGFFFCRYLFRVAYLCHHFLCLLLLGSDHFPLHLKGALPEEFILCICQVDSDFATIKDVVVTLNC